MRRRRSSIEDILEAKAAALARGDKRAAGVLQLILLNRIFELRQHAKAQKVTAGTVEAVERDALLAAGGR